MARLPRVPGDGWLGLLVGAALGAFGACAGDGGGTAQPPDVDAATADSRPPDLRAASPDTGAARDSGPMDVAADSPSPLDVAPVGVDAPDAPAQAPDAATACGVCTSWGTPELLGRIGASGLAEVSGLAASFRNPGVLYVHNDRNRPEFYALDERATLLGRFTPTGPSAAVRDVEDMEIGPCAAGTCVYLADLGNNVNPRTDFVILRVPEPDVAPGRPPVTVAVTTFERFVFSYPDGPHNAESLLIDQATGAVYVITKTAGPSAVYRVPLDPARATTAVKVADLTVPTVEDTPATAGSAHPCGGGFLLRTNRVLYELRITPGTPFEQAFRATPIVLPAGNEVQSEAVSYRRDGRAYYTTTEGANPPIHRVVCR